MKRKQEEEEEEADDGEDDDDNGDYDYYYYYYYYSITKRIIMKAMNISIRSSYYIFCRRNKPWTNPELLTI